MRLPVHRGREFRKSRNRETLPMSEHFTRSTVSAAFYCSKCGKSTQHRIDDKRKGPCLECIRRLNEKHDQEKPEQTQQELFHV
jgi:DNA replicative helicase MCM subunit Mcm2 (Cdc46/Mcm family)